LKDIKPNQVIVVKEGEGIVRTMQFEPPRIPSQRSEESANMHDGKPKIVISLLLLAASLAFAAPVKDLPFGAWTRASNEPILSPQGGTWESAGTFNPAVHFSSQGCQQTRSRQICHALTVRRTLRVPRASVMREY